MKKYLLIGTGAAMLAGGVAFAQMPPNDMDRGMARMGGDEDGPHGPGMMPRHEGEMMMMHHHHRMDEAATFRFKRGDMEIEIKCAEREPTQACVNAAGTLLDKLSNAPTPPKTN